MKRNYSELKRPQNSPDLDGANVSHISKVLGLHERQVDRCVSRQLLADQFWDAGCLGVVGGLVGAVAGAVGAGLLSPVTLIATGVAVGSALLAHIAGTVSMNACSAKYAAIKKLGDTAGGIVGNKRNLIETRIQGMIAKFDKTFPGFRTSRASYIGDARSYGHHHAMLEKIRTYRNTMSLSSN